MLAVTWLNARNPQVFTGDAWVIDGDTIIMDGEKLRLSGIDAPEISQKCEKPSGFWNCGLASKKALRKMVLERDISCKTGGLDRYDRWLVVCKGGGIDINAALVSNGWAVDYGGYAREEAKARRAKSGIWQGSFENPQEWRHANRGEASSLPPQSKGWWDKTTAWVKKMLE